MRAPTVTTTVERRYCDGCGDETPHEITKGTRDVLIECSVCGEGDYYGLMPEEAEEEARP